MNKYVNMHIYPSGLEHESRIEKSAVAALKTGLFDRVIIIGKKNKNKLKVNQLSKKVAFVRLAGGTTSSSIFLKILFFLFWYYEIFKFSFQKNIRMISAHSLSSLPIAWILAFCKNSLLIYEPHELESEVLRYNHYIKKAFFVIEKILLAKAATIITVSPSITQWYKDKLNKKNKLIRTILNIPIGTSVVCPRQQISKKCNTKNTFLYLGILSEERNISLLLEIFSKNTNVKLVVIGHGDQENKVRRYAAKYINIKYFKTMAWEKIKSLSPIANYGISILQPYNINHKLALPNNMFQYISLGIPVIVLKNTAQEKILKPWKMNISIDKPKSLGLFLENINNYKYPSYKNIQAVQARFNWKCEENKLIKIFTQSVISNEK